MNDENIVIIRRSNRPTDSLSAFVMSVIDMMHSCEKHNVNGFVDARPPYQYEIYKDTLQTEKQPNMWEWYFEQPMVSIPTENIVNYPIWLDNQNYTVYPSEHERKKVFQKYLKFNKYVLNEFNKIIEKYNIDLDNTLSISHRGTDRIVDGTISPIEKYFPVVDSLLKKNPNLKIVTKPEEEHILTKLKSKYPNLIFVDTMFVLKNESPRIHIDALAPFSGFEKGLHAVLLSILYSKSKFLVKNTSNLTLISTFLSKHQIYHINPDGSFLHYDETEYNSQSL